LPGCVQDSFSKGSPVEKHFSRTTSRSNLALNSGLVNQVFDSSAEAACGVQDGQTNCRVFTYTTRWRLTTSRYCSVALDVQWSLSLQTYSGAGTLGQEPAPVT
jgi:hypothetical protein